LRKPRNHQLSIADQNQLNLTKVKSVPIIEREMGNSAVEIRESVGSTDIDPHIDQNGIRKLTNSQI
jgi:hypothetical protein